MGSPDAYSARRLLRVARRDGGVRLFAAREQTASPDDPQAAHDFLIDVAVNKYAPLPAPNSVSGASGPYCSEQSG